MKRDKKYCNNCKEKINGKYIVLKNTDGSVTRIVCRKCQRQVSEISDKTGINVLKYFANGDTRKEK